MPPVDLSPVTAFNEKLLANTTPTTSTTSNTNPTTPAARITDPTSRKDQSVPEPGIEQFD
ncbi:MAG: hypothetical protein OEW29_15040 [Acidimicrobiia bacterium]|nr:hypothetical protein [Acidimicrobiia bacterium]